VRSNLFINLLEHTKFNTDITSALGGHVRGSTVRACSIWHIEGLQHTEGSMLLAAVDKHAEAGTIGIRLSCRSSTVLQCSQQGWSRWQLHTLLNRSCLYTHSCCCVPLLCASVVESFEGTDKQYLEHNDNASRDDG
jgi:hypothetical protein